MVSPCRSPPWFGSMLLLRVERPPRGLACPLVLNLEEPLVQGKVVPDRVLRWGRSVLSRGISALRLVRLVLSRAAKSVGI